MLEHAVNQALIFPILASWVINYYSQHRHKTLITGIAISVVREELVETVKDPNGFGFETSAGCRTHIPVLLESLIL
ncbi:hypothetical protein BDV41DRAFT_533892 [Aspergillus transmontanensis]|uniref:Uncharacterized protein n=1 Tax=Aspergillus transmontanensis TaxID=1034304 RepID=A0A5N6W0B3_9EURO|nr:hypothetical protein BDV41DRAFT_533892 [Aspergillus transmontanensis]